MNSAVQDFLVAGLSFLFGAGIERWWNRARPLVMLQGFTDICKNREDIQCSPELSELTFKAWDVERLHEGQVSLAEIQKVRRQNGIVLEGFK